MDHLRGSLIHLETSPSERAMFDTAPSPPNISSGAMERAFRQALRKRDTSTVKQLLVEGVSLTSRDKSQKTPLHLCTLLYSDRSNKWPNEKIILHDILAAVSQFDSKMDILDGFDNWGKTPIYTAIEDGNMEVVDILVKSGANIGKISDKNETALHVAIKHPHVLKYLLDLNILKNSADIDGNIPIHEAARLNVVESVELLLKQFGREQLMQGSSSGSSAYHEAARSGSLEVIEFLDVDYKPHVDNNGETPLNIAAKRRHKAVTAALLKNGAALSDKGHNGVTVINQVVKHFDNPLKFFDDVFNECINLEATDFCNPTKKERRVIVNYRLLASRDASGMSQIKVIEDLVKCGHSQLLLHPLLESLLYLKWKCLLPVVYTIIAIYGVFLISFNSFVVTLIYKRDVHKTIMARFPNKTCIACFECLDGLNWIWLILIYLCICLLLGQECYYIYLQKHRYFLLLESWVKLSLMTLAAVVPTALIVHCGQPPAWLRHVTCAALLLSWLQAMHLLSRFPHWGYYVLMFERVAYNIFKIFLTSVCLIIGFSLSFMIEYQSVSPFDGPGNAFVKTLIMMASEFDYEGLFGKEHAKELQETKTVVHLMFVVFVVFIAVVLMNFIIGVAVSDINHLDTIGNIRRLEKQVELQSTLGVLIDSLITFLEHGSLYWTELPSFLSSWASRFPHMNYHYLLSMSKDLKSNKPWFVIVDQNECWSIPYYQSISKELEIAIINIAKSKRQREITDYKKNVKKIQLNRIYNAVTGMPSLPEKTEREQESLNNWDDVYKKRGSLNEKVNAMELSIKEIKQTINELKENSKTILETIVNSKNTSETYGERDIEVKPYHAGP